MSSGEFARFMREDIDALLPGEACDIVILTHAQVAELTALGRVDPGTVSDLGAVQTSIAVRAGDAIPDVSTPEALRAVLLAATAVHFPDPRKATAGIHFAKVLEKLGLVEALASRLRTHDGGIPAMAALAAGGPGGLGCTQATEIVSSPGVTMAAPLPAPLGLATVYTAAVDLSAKDPESAHGFIERMTSRDAAPARSALGFEGVAIRRARRSDEAAIRELVFGILAEFSIAPDPGMTDLDLSDLEAHYFARGGTFDAAIDAAGRLVACCGTYAVDESTCELRKMYVRADQRGQGLGARLLDRALAFARARGASRVTLETASVLKTAMAMYEKAGFVRQPHAPHVPRCDRAYALELD